MKFLSIKRSPSVMRTVIRDRYDKVIDDTVVITYGVTVRLKLGKWQKVILGRGAPAIGIRMEGYSEET